MEVIKRRRCENGGGLRNWVRIKKGGVDKSKSIHFGREVINFKIVKKERSCGSFEECMDSERGGGNKRD